MTQTTQAARLSAAESAFVDSSLPVFKIEESPFRTFHVESSTDLPIYEPFTPASYKYFRGTFRDMHGIEVDPETGNYIVTVCSTVDEKRLYRLLSDLVG